MPKGTYKRTAEHRAANSAAHRGKRHSPSPETRAKLSAALKGRPLSPEHRAKLSAAHVGKHPSLEARAAFTAARSLPLGSTHQNHGYTIIKTESGWQRRNRVMAGLTPGDGKIAHHKDGDKMNDDPDNLRVFESNAVHAHHHNEERRYV